MMGFVQYVCPLSVYHCQALSAVACLNVLGKVVSILVRQSRPISQLLEPLLCLTSIL